MTTTQQFIGELALSTDPTSIIVTGFDADQAYRIGADQSARYTDMGTCMFTDCPEQHVWVLESTMNDAIYLYGERDVDDDELLIVCKRHHDDINNVPRITGRDEIGVALSILRDNDSTVGAES